MAVFGLQREEKPKPVEVHVCEVWPQHVDALHLFQACMGQMQLNLGGMGAANWRAAQSLNVAQEARWLDFHGKRQAVVVRDYRVIEQEALRLLNDREAAAAQEK